MQSWVISSQAHNQPANISYISQGKIFTLVFAIACIFTIYNANRNSAMTEMLKIIHFKTVQNIFVAVLFVALMNTIIYNIFDNGVLLGTLSHHYWALAIFKIPVPVPAPDFPLLLWCFGKFDHAVLVWLVLFAFSFLAPILQMAIVRKYLPTRYLALMYEDQIDTNRLHWRVAYTVYVVSCCFMLVAVPKYIRAFDFPPPTSAFVMCEFIRLLMKMHSFLVKVSFVFIKVFLPTYVPHTDDKSFSSLRKEGWW